MAGAVGFDGQADAAAQRIAVLRVFLPQRPGREWPPDWRCAVGLRAAARFDL
jgi:hypothetical protein